MNLRHLHPVDTGDQPPPSYFDRLHGWMDSVADQFARGPAHLPRAALLCGLPGVGKATAAKALARSLGLPIARADPALHICGPHETGSTRPMVLWIDEPQHAPILSHRWLTDTTPTRVFAVFTTTAPQALPPWFTRADVMSAIWHLDLPDTRQRAEIWGDLLSAACVGHHDHDSVQLGHLSPMFTVAEIHAAFANACAVSGYPPHRESLIDSVLAIRPVAVSMDENLAHLRHWARVHAENASSVPNRTG